MNLIFPTRTLRRVWHTGTLDPADKRPGSHEGAGLSVSIHPDAWERIARHRIRGTRHVLTCRDGAFLAVQRLQARHRTAIAEWAVAQGYAVVAEIFETTVPDEASDGTLVTGFLSRDEACEAGSGAAVRAVAGLVATPHLSRRHGREDGIVTVAHDLAPLYAEDMLDLDGAWWNDVLDVESLSAPRGVIAPSKLGRWTIRPTRASRHRKGAWPGGNHAPRLEPDCTSWRAATDPGLSASVLDLREPSADPKASISHNPS